MTNLELKELRQNLGLTQVEMAKKVGVDVKTIQNWESGRKIPASKDGILRSLIPDAHIVFGGQNVQHGDAINGNKVVEQIREQETTEEKVTIIEKVECDLDKIRTELADLKKTHAEVVAQNSRLLAIIETLTKTPAK